MEPIACVGEIAKSGVCVSAVSEKDRFGMLYLKSTVKNKFYGKILPFIRFSWYLLCTKPKSIPKCP